jgi:hypothetical protein
MSYIDRNGVRHILKKTPLDKSTTFDPSDVYYLVTRQDTITSKTHESYNVVILNASNQDGQRHLKLLQWTSQGVVSRSYTQHSSELHIFHLNAVIRNPILISSKSSLAHEDPSRSMRAKGLLLYRELANP